MTSAVLKSSPVTSADLAETTAILGKARLVDETVLRETLRAPQLTRRELRFEGSEVVRRGAAALAGACRFAGYTTFAPPYVRADPLTPSLELEGQRFFDAALSTGELPVLLLVGGRQISPPAGFYGERAAIVDGSAAGQPVRPLLLAGVDGALAATLPALLGWQSEVSPAAVERTLAAGHPLLALDALRIMTSRDSDDTRAELVETLAGWLLHPAQHPAARVAALDLVATALSRLRPGSTAADALVRLTLWHWRLDRQHAVGAAYLDAWNLAAAQVRRSDVAKELRAMALDETAAQTLRDLQAQLRKSLGEGGGR